VSASVNDILIFSLIPSNFTVDAFND
jgi:hypothetical protein